MASGTTEKEAEMGALGSQLGTVCETRVTYGLWPAAPFWRSILKKACSVCADVCTFCSLKPVPQHRA